MPIFKKYTCSECSQKMSSVAKRFSNEKILCKNCAGLISAFGLQSNIPYEKYIEIKEYQEKNYAKYYQAFHETYSYGNIHMDAKSHLFYIGDKIDENTIFLTFRSIKLYNFNYEALENAKVFLGGVACKVSISIDMRCPDISYRYTVFDRAKAVYEDSEYYCDWDGDTYIDEYSLDWPVSLKKFLQHFYEACKKTGTQFRNEIRNPEIDAYRKEIEKDPLMYACNFSDEEILEIKREKEEIEAETEARLEWEYNRIQEENAILDYLDTLEAPDESALSEEEYTEIMELLQNSKQVIEEDK